MTSENYHGMFVLLLARKKKRCDKYKRTFVGLLYRLVCDLRSTKDCLKDQKLRSQSRMLRDESLRKPGTISG